MPLQVDQLIYTNLPKTGFQLLTSPRVPLAVQEGFIHQVVYQLWDAYNPPPPDQRKIFLHQLSPTETLFGWLYVDGQDELGRSNIPYFLGYSWSGELHLGQLENMVNYLAKGPFAFIPREDLTPNRLEALTLPDTYPPARPGVDISDDDIARLAALLTNHKLLQFQAVALTPPNAVPEDIPPIAAQDSLARTTQPGLDHQGVEDLFTAVLLTEASIRGLLLVNSQGDPLTQLITPPDTPEATPWTADALGNLAKQWLAIAALSQQTLTLEGFNHGELHLETGHLVLSYCALDCYLLTITAPLLTGVLEVEVKRILRKLAALAAGDPIPPDPFRPPRPRSPSPSSPSLRPWSPIPPSPFPPETEILYRGRRLNA